MYTVVHNLDDDAPCEEFLIAYSENGEYLKVLVDYNGFWWNPIELVHMRKYPPLDQLYDAKRVDMLPLHMYWREDSHSNIHDVISKEYDVEESSFYVGEDLESLFTPILTMRELVL